MAAKLGPDLVPRYQLGAGQVFIGIVCSRCSLPVPLVRGGVRFATEPTMEDVSRVCACPGRPVARGRLVRRRFRYVMT